MKVFAINGSARKDGNTAILIGHVLGELKNEGIETELYQLAGKRINGCTACYRCFDNQDKQCVQNDDCVNECIGKMLDADGIILGSPVYFSDVTAGIKGLLERAGMVSRANGNMFKRKVGASIVAVRRGGAIHTYDTLNHFFGITEMLTVGSSYWNMGIGTKIKGDVEKDDEGILTMNTLGQNMAWAMKRVHE